MTQQEIIEKLRFTFSEVEKTDTFLQRILFSNDPVLKNGRRQKMSSIFFYLQNRWWVCLANLTL